MTGAELAPAGEAVGDEKSSPLLVGAARWRQAGPVALAPAVRI